MSWEAWAPYRGIPGTNTALEMLRSDGFSAGTMSKYPRAQFNKHAAALRSAIAFKAKTQLRGVQLTEPVDLTIFFVLYPAWDDDAGLIAAKWVIDGLVTAGLCTRDRRVFRGVTVRTIREWQDAPASIRDFFPPQPGVLIHVNPT
jgi:hypothetical protein